MENTPKKSQTKAVLDFVTKGLNKYKYYTTLQTIFALLVLASLLGGIAAVVVLRNITPLFIGTIVATALIVVVKHFGKKGHSVLIEYITKLPEMEKAVETDS